MQQLRVFFCVSFNNSSLISVIEIVIESASLFQGGPPCVNREVFTCLTIGKKYFTTTCVASIRTDVCVTLKYLDMS